MAAASVRRWRRTWHRTWVADLRDAFAIYQMQCIRLILVTMEEDDLDFVPSR
jgi:hypothetical protein